MLLLEWNKDFLFVFSPDSLQVVRVLDQVEYEILESDTLCLRTCKEECEAFIYHDAFVILEKVITQ